MDENETSMDDFENEAIDVEGDGEGSTGPSIEESIAAAFDELENEGTDEPEAEQGIQGNEGQEPEKPALSASEAASILAKSKGQKGKGAKRQTFEAEELKGQKGGREPKPQEAQPAEEYHPPQAWDMSAREEFHKLPPVAKKETLAFWKRLDAHFHNGSQELARGKQKYGRLEEVENYYRPHLDQNGIDFAEGTRQLWGSHHEITNPQTRIQGIDKVLRANGVTPEQLYQYRQSMGGQPQQQQNYSQQPAQPLLTRDQIAPIIRQELEQYQTQTAQSADADELQQLRNQVGQDGRAIYPELWDNQNLQANYWNVGYLQRVQPLVEYERKSHPGISVAEATKRAIQLLRLRDGQQSGTPAASIPRLTTTDPETIRKARSANVSLRGRGNGAIPTVTAAKRGETVEESLFRSYDQLSNGTS